MKATGAILNKRKDSQPLVDVGRCHSLLIIAALLLGVFTDGWYLKVRIEERSAFLFGAL